MPTPFPSTRPPASDVILTDGSTARRRFRQMTFPG